MVHMSNTTVSPAQIRFIEDLLTQRKAVLGIDSVQDFIQAQNITTLTKKAASTLIDELRRVPSVVVVQGPAPSVPQSPPGRPFNSYPGACVECKQNVAAREGWREKRGGSWVVHHHDGQCPAQASSDPDHQTGTGAADVRGTVSNLLLDVLDGYYAFPSKTGNNDLDFIRVSTNKGFYNPANKGKRKVQRVLGGHGAIDISHTEQLDYAHILAKLSTHERAEAQARYGVAIGRCGRCGIELTDEDSRALGLGPDCRKKVGL